MLSLFALLTAAAPAAPQDKFINADALRAHVGFLADDALEGRGPATKGDALAQRYIAAQFQAMGLKTWSQPFDIVGVDGHPETIAAQAGSAKASFKFHDEFIAVSGHQGPNSKLEGAEVVFVGFGIVAPEFQWDDFKGVDLKGKVVLVMNSDPEGDPALFAGKARLWYGRWDYKYEMAAKQGAAGCIIIHTTPSAGYPWQVVQTSWSGEQFDLPAGDEPSLQVKAWMTEEASTRLAALGGKDLAALRAAALTRDFKPVPLGVKVSTSFSNAVKKKETANVLALLPGSDGKLKDEWVVFTSHHDHLGKKADAKPGEDAIYNGAVDNASGVASMLAVARALTALPSAPRRTVLFAAVAAEEQGLLGSQFLVAHPPIPHARMAANINVDGANIWGRTKDVSVVGLGKSSLDGFIEALAKKQGRVVKPDELSDRGFFYRSDQFNFAKAGVPAAYFASGNDYLGRPEGWGKKQREQWEANTYHRPSDQLTDAWDFSGAVEDAKLYFGLLLEVANAKAMPSWNKGDEFEAARRRSLAGPEALPGQP
jgi:Zn-dependent M28 family amino/carboxypeptidase